MNETLLDVLMEAGIRAKDQRYVRSTPNNLGEALRNWAFLERIGGHNCFNVREDFKEVWSGDRELKVLGLESERPKVGLMKWFKHEDSNLEMGWYYHTDSDEIALFFYIPELSDTNVTGVLMNNECSKDYMWYFQEKNSG